MNDIFAKVKELFKNKEYDKALIELQLVEKDFSIPLPPNIYVLKGVCILLGKDINAPLELKDAEEAYLKALEIDSEHINALLELGFFYMNVEDDAGKALSQFKKAFTLSRSQFTEAIQGYAECLNELESKEKALEFIKESINNPVHFDKIEKTRKYIDTGKIE